MALHTIAQDSYDDKVKKYVATYYDLAIQEQLRCGIPAAVTLGQGILETEAGCSELATNANNHFGIKCKKEWKGPTFAHTDDRPNECFRKYGCAQDSYKDHSDYLKTGPRYASLFKLSPTDYAAWAFGLKRCGYATNPVYAQKLIKIIEDYELQEYTYKALNENIVYKQPKPKEDKRYDEAFNSAEPATDSPAFKKIAEAADEARATITTTPVLARPLPVNTKGQTGGILKINELKAIKAYKGDMLLQYAVQYNIRYERILEYNDLPDAPLAEDMYLYLEKKPGKGAHETHTVQKGETMWQIAQNEPMQLQRLLSYNQLQAGEEAAPGSVLQLQHYTRMKPRLCNVPDFMNSDLAKKDAAVKAPQADYIVKDPTVKRTVQNIPVPPVAVATTATPPPSTSDLAVNSPSATTPATDVASVPAATVVTPAPEVKETVSKPDVTLTTTPSETKDPVVMPVSPSATQITTTTPAPTETKEIATAPVVKEIPASTPLDATPTQEATAAPGPPDPNDELAVLKAKLDKVVYAADDKPVVKAAPASTAPVAQPVVPAKAPVVQEEKKLHATKKGGAQYYVVKKGDTAFKIAKQNNITVQQLMDLNGYKRPMVALGQKVRVK